MVERRYIVDGFFRTNIVILIVFSFCCNFIAFILGIVGLITCTDPIARRNALVVTILGGLFGGLGTAMSLFRGQFGF
jgi:hypothetical protein